MVVYLSIILFKDTLALSLDFTSIGITLLLSVDMIGGLMKLIMLNYFFIA